MRAHPLRVPSRRVSALLVLGFLGFGVLLGGAAGSRVSDTLAASVAPLKLVLRGEPERRESANRSKLIERAERLKRAPESEAPPAEEPATPAPAAHKHHPGRQPRTRAPRKENPRRISTPAATATKLPPIKHVFVIMLSDEPYAAVFGPASTAHYLSGTLEHRGTLLVRYDAVAHEELANELALLSGQGPTVETAANCPTYSDLVPATPAADGQVSGQRLRLPAADADAAWRAERQAPQLARLRRGHRRRRAGQPAGLHAPRRSGSSDPSAVGRRQQRSLRDVPQPLRLLPLDHRLARMRDATIVGLGALHGDLAATSARRASPTSFPTAATTATRRPARPARRQGLAPADAFLGTSRARRSSPRRPTSRTACL